MKVNQITVHAGRTFNHPYEQYSNLRPEVTLVATLDEGDDPSAATRELQQSAESLVEDHKNAMLKSLKEIEAMRIADQELADLGRTVKRAQDRINDLRKEHPSLLLGASELESEEGL